MIYLRALEPEDLDLLYTIENHPSLWTVSNNNGPYSRFLLKRYLASQTGSIAEDGQMRLVVCLEADDRAIGIVDLFDYSAKHQRAEVGIALLSAEQGKGVGSETLRKLEEFAAVKLNIRMLYAYTMANPATISRKLFISAGYAEIGVLKEWHFDGEEYEDVSFFQKNIQKKR